MKEREKGYTLIELTIALSITVTIFLLVISGIGIYRKLVNNMIRKSTIYEISSLLSYSKEYCSNRSLSGRLVVDIDKNEINFLVNSNIIKKVKLEKEVVFGEITGGVKKNINSLGYIVDAGSITIKDKLGRTSKITIQAASNYIRVYEDGK